MSTLRFIASRPTWLLFWVCMGVDWAASWAAAWFAVWTSAIRGAPVKLTPSVAESSLRDPGKGRS